MTRFSGQKNCDGILRASAVCIKIFKIVRRFVGVKVLNYDRKKEMADSRRYCVYTKKR